MQLASRGERRPTRGWPGAAGYSCYKFACVQYSVDLHDIVLIWPVRRSPTELRVQPTPDGSGSIASSVDFDTTFFFAVFGKSYARG